MKNKMTTDNQHELFLDCGTITLIGDLQVQDVFTLGEQNSNLFRVLEKYDSFVIAECFKSYNEDGSKQNIKVPLNAAVKQCTK